MTKAELQAKCSSLDISFDENDTVERLALLIKGAESDEKIKALEDNNTDLQASVDTLTEFNNELQKELENSEKKLSAGPSVLPVVTYKSKKYQIAYPNIVVDRKKYSAEEVEANSDLIEQLFKMKSGMLIPIKKD